MAWGLRGTVTGSNRAGNMRMGLHCRTPGKSLGYNKSKPMDLKQAQLDLPARILDGPCCDDPWLRGRKGRGVAIRAVAVRRQHAAIDRNLCLKGALFCASLHNAERGISLVAGPDARTNQPNGGVIYANFPKLQKLSGVAHSCAIAR